MSREPAPPAPEPAEVHNPRLRVLGFGAAICAVAIVILVAAIPSRDDGIFTDRLGPDAGESLAGYFDRARGSLAGGGDGDHWALVSFTDYQPAGALLGKFAGVRVGQVLYRVPLPRVATPFVAIPVPDSARALQRSGRDASWQLTERRRYTADGTRGARILDVSIAELRAECACSPGAVVRAPLPQLRELATRPGIRAVQALPADAVAERFAVTPLLPDAADPIAPPPDDGPVPSR